MESILMEIHAFERASDTFLFAYDETHCVYTHVYWIYLENEERAEVPPWHLPLAL